ncbi:MAG: hypothetical protein AAF152_08740 [Cyanobacteria bacterium P01_A01_bin.114]
MNQNSPKVQRGLSGKIMALWTIFLLGTLFYNQLTLRPAFHALSLAESPTSPITMGAIMGFMLIFFTLPMLVVIAAAFSPSRRFRGIHFGFTLIYSAFNLLHFAIDVWMALPPYQLVLMAFLFIIGLLLNIIAYQWWQSKLDKYRHFHSIYDS